MSGSYLIDQSTLTDICDAVRAKNGKTELYRSDQLADEIMRINGFCATEENGRTELLVKADTVSIADTNAFLSTISPESHVRLVGCKWTAEDEYEIERFYNALDNFKGIDNYGNEMDTVNASGTIHTHFVHQSKRIALKNRFKDISIIPDVIGFEVFYYNHDGSELLYTERVATGGNAVYDGTAYREQDENGTYTHTGWSTTKNGEPNSSFRTNVTGDLKVYATFSSTPRKYVVSYYNYDGTSLVLSETVTAGGNSVFEGEPGRDQDEQYSYVFVGWSKEVGGEADETAQQNVHSDLNLYPVYQKKERTYTVNFYNGETLLESTTVSYGEDAQYTGELSELVQDGSPFKGWSPSVRQVKSNVNAYAKYATLGEEVEIEDSWSEIIAAVKDGTYVDKYEIGQCKTIPLENEAVRMQIVAMNAEKDNHGNTASISWLMKGVMATYKQWDMFSTASNLYWEYATIRSYLNLNIFYQLPVELQNAILPITKESMLSTSVTNVQTTTDKVWLASYKECFLDIESGGIYHVAFPDNAYRIKKMPNGSIATWWLRDRYSSSYTYYVYTSGATNNTSPTSNAYIAFGFCI